MQENTSTPLGHSETSLPLKSSYASVISRRSWTHLITERENHKGTPKDVPHCDYKNSMNQANRSSGPFSKDFFHAAASVALLFVGSLSNSMLSNTFIMSPACSSNVPIARSWAGSSCNIWFNESYKAQKRGVTWLLFLREEGSEHWRSGIATFGVASCDSSASRYFAYFPHI